MMRKTHVVAVLAMVALVVPATSQAAYFHSDFTEASLGAITGLNKDSPAGPTQDFSLNTTNDTLDFVTTNADMWNTRNNAPIAWVAAPTVGLTETWEVHTYVSMQKDGSNSQEVAGITFYADVDNSRPDFGLGLDDWNGWHPRLQGLGDNNPNVGGAPLGTAPGVFLRVTITEGGATDTYNFFYKVNSGDAWTQLGGAATNFTSNFSNARVGLFLKSSAGGGGAQYDYLTITPEPGTMAVIALGGLAVLRRRRRR